MTPQNIISVLTKPIEFATVKHPLACFGITGILVTSIGAISLVWLLNTYSQTWTLSITITVLLILAVIFGIILMMAALIFYALSHLRSRIKKYQWLTK